MAREVLPEPRLLLSAVGLTVVLTQWRWVITTAMGSRTWPRTTVLAAAFRSDSAAAPELLPGRRMSVWELVLSQLRLEISTTMASRTWPSPTITPAVSRFSRAMAAEVLAEWLLLMSELVLSRLSSEISTLMGSRI